MTNKSNIQISRFNMFLATFVYYHYVNLSNWPMEDRIRGAEMCFWDDTIKMHNSLEAINKQLDKLPIAEIVKGNEA